ncbi:MAG: hypothetical protein E6I70_15870, partial [Chloroflexi bacterium]
SHSAGEQGNGVAHPSAGELRPHPLQGHRRRVPGGLDPDQPVTAERRLPVRWRLVRCLCARCVFAGCVLARCVFPGCVFARCVFPRCVFPRCILARCLLARCLFPGCLFTGCLFIERLQLRWLLAGHPNAECADRKRAGRHQSRPGRVWLSPNAKPDRGVGAGRHRERIHRPKHLGQHH